jgi:hypothetical protein
MVAKYQEELDPEDQVNIDSNTNYETITANLNESEVPIVVNCENESENELEKTLTPKPIVSNVLFPMNTLNSDDISTLENIYRTANSRNTSAPSCSLTTGTPTSADNSEKGSESGSVSTKSLNKSQNKNKNKTKKKSKKKKQITNQSNDSGDEDARRLEEFLGTEKSSRDAKSYELL